MLSRSQIVQLLIVVAALASLYWAIEVMQEPFEAGTVAGTMSPPEARMAPPARPSEPVVMGDAEPAPASEYEFSDLVDTFLDPSQDYLTNGSMLGELSPLTKFSSKALRADPPMPEGDGFRINANSMPPPVSYGFKGITNCPRQ